MVKSIRAFAKFAIVVSISFALLCLVTLPTNAWSQTNSFPSSGSVGIGTTSPSTLLDVHVGTNANLDVTGPIANATGVTLNIANDAYNANVPVEIRASVTTLGTVGNVGIGTSSPTNPLHVSGTTDNIARFDCTDSGDCWIRISSGGVDVYLASGKSLGDFGLVGTFSSHPFAIRTNNTERVWVDASGNVGIGTNSPSTKLDVNGDVTVSGNISAKYQDLAEWVPAEHAMKSGTVVVLDSKKHNFVIPSSRSYDTRVAGVVSINPGIVLGVAGIDKVKIATTGRVKVRVDAAQDPIEVGDLLVTSDREGMAKKSRPLDFGGIEIHRPGTLIGKALEPLPSGDGEILVLLSLQ